MWTFTWGQIVDWYREPLFWQFPVASIFISTLSFAMFAGPLTWMAAVAPSRLERYRIQSRRARAQDLVGPSITCWLRNNLWHLGLVFVAWPLLRLTGVHGGTLPHWYVIAGQLIFFVYLDDFLFYWMHRALHTRTLFRRVHAWHHRIYTPWAVTGNYMHPLEYVLIGTVALTGPILVGAHLLTLWLWLIFRQWEAAEGHCGYDLPWTPTHLLPFNDGAIHHDVHHAKVKGNYAGFLYWTDLVFGTLCRGYRAELAGRHPWVTRGT